MIPILTFCGNSNSGKTTVIVKVIEILSQKGYKIASIKHDGHGHDISCGNTGDSVKHKAAGTVCSIVSNNRSFIVHCDSGKDLSPEELMTMIPADCSIVICEGYKKSDLPKIEVLRKGAIRVLEDDPNLVAIATDDKSIITDTHILDLNAPSDIADFIENNFIRQPQDINITLIVNGKQIYMKDFIEKMLYNSVNGLIKPLRGCEEPKEIIIKAVYR